MPSCRMSVDELAFQQRKSQEQTSVNEAMRIVHGLSYVIWAKGVQGVVMDIDQTYEMPFSTDVIYAAWVSAETVIAPATRLEIDPVVGGHYRLFIESPESVMHNYGKFLAVTPCRHLTYTWEWNRDGQVSEVSVDFTAIEGGSRIRIRHSGLDTLASVRRHAAGWDDYIEKLTRWLSSNLGEPLGE